jgi:hypothetical protein
MGIIDKQRVAAVATLQSLGYTFSLIDGWAPPPEAARTSAATAIAEADVMHALLLLRADKLDGCCPGTEEAIELDLIGNAAEAYEARRWPLGKVEGGKG